MVEASVSAISYFMPIFAFLLVFIIIYAILKKTQVLGGNEAIMLFISFILSSFFIVESSIVEFVQFSSSWVVAGAFILFILMMVLAFVPGLDLAAFLGKGKGSWFAWFMLAAVLGIFLVSAFHVFNWVMDWGMIRSWFDTEWFGMILLLVIAWIVSWKIKG